MQTMFAIILAILSAGSAVAYILGRSSNEEMRELVENLKARIKAWWIMVAVFAISVFIGKSCSILLFAFISVLALREFVTLAPTRPADHRTLGWAFFAILPFNYWLISTNWYGLFSIFVPVYAFLWLPVRSALSGDSENFLARTAEIQWGVMLCIYFVSYAPAILSLAIPGGTNQTAHLLCFLVLVVQMSDVLQYVFGKLFGKHKIVPSISPNKTVEGFLGGILSAVALGAGLYWITPFNPWQAALMALAIALSGFAGGIVMSAIKRDRGVKDYGNLIPGHGGMIDRIDSLCFAAPIFFHLTRYFFAH